MKALFILNHEIRARVYPPPIFDEIAALVDVYVPPQTPEMVREDPGILHDMELLFSSWTCPPIDAAFLAHAPNLKVVFYGAGSIKHLVSTPFWERGVRITHANKAMSITVAQYTVGQIILSLAGMWQHMQDAKRERAFTAKQHYPGLFRSTVGIIGLGLIARHMCELLKAFDVDVIAFDPYASAETAAALDVKLVDLETLFKTAHVVSLHAPWLPETEGMITGKHLASMQPYSTFINTARGALVNEADLIAVLRDRPDLFAVLDVTHPEPPPADSALYDLPNVILTPHIAGPLAQRDSERLGMMMVDELRAYLHDDTLHWEITAERLKTMA